MVSTLRCDRKCAEGGAMESGGNYHGGAAGTANMASQEDTLGPEAQRAVQGAQGGVQGVGVNPWGFGYGSGLTKFSAKGGGRGLQRI
jgi:hypothetical protein